MTTQDDIQRVQLKLKAASDPKILQDALFVGGETLKRIIAEYPPVSRRKQPFKSDKQRRYFFWALRHPEVSKLVVPYYRGQNPRSERLWTRWTVRKGGNANSVIVANNASYAGLVQSWRSQTAYHKQTGWKTDRDVIEHDKNRIVDDVRKAYSAALQSAMGKA